MNAASTNLRKLVKIINLRGFDKYVIFKTNLRTKTAARWMEIQITIMETDVKATHRH